jgi:hypothetical protein
MPEIPSPKQFLGIIVGIIVVVMVLNALLRYIQTFGGGSGVIDLTSYIPAFVLTLEFLIPGASIALGLVYLLTRDSGF